MIVILLLAISLCRVNQELIDSNIFNFVDGFVNKTGLIYHTPLAGKCFGGAIRNIATLISQIQALIGTQITPSTILSLSINFLTVTKGEFDNCPDFIQLWNTVSLLFKSMITPYYWTNYPQHIFRGAGYAYNSGLKAYDSYMNYDYHYMGGNISAALFTLIDESVIVIS